MKKINKTLKFIGQLNLDKEIIIADPCYTMGVTWVVKIENLVSGTYKAYIYTDANGKIANLYMCKDNVNINKYIDSIDKLVSNTIMVDSGTCGIFNAYGYMPTHEDQKSDIYNEWYEKYLVSQSHKQYLISEDMFGIWVQSGYGDGQYSLYVNNMNNPTILELDFN
jgi:hypothetical protein